MPFLPPWLVAIVTHIGFKVMSIILALALIWLAIFSWIKIHDAKIRAKALTECPPQNIYNGPTTVIQGKKMGCFPLHIGKWGIGICHE